MLQLLGEFLRQHKARHSSVTYPMMHILYTVSQKKTVVCVYSFITWSNLNRYSKCLRTIS